MSEQTRKRALIFGLANSWSLAHGIARALHARGFELGFTYQDARLERRVRPIAESLQARFALPCDVSAEAEVDAVFERARQEWGGLDALVHSLAFARMEDLEGRFVDTTRDGFRLALEVSAYSLVELARKAERMMSEGGSIVTLTYYGAEKVMPSYNVMGVAKAALEASVRYLAYDLGPRRIRVNAISAGPIKTLASSAFPHFGDKLERARANSPLGETITQDDVGAMAAFLASDEARHITGSVFYVDSGLHMMGAERV